MRIYLVQHGKCVSKEENLSRPLSDEGRREVERMAEYLKGAGVRADEIFHSGKARARETAHILGSAVCPGKAPSQKQGLAPLDEVDEIARALSGVKNDVVIVGHLPHLSRLASHLTGEGKGASAIRFQNAGVACLEQDEEKATFKLAWMVVPELLGA